jgi:hypothetical protein
MPIHAMEETLTNQKASPDQRLSADLKKAELGEKIFIQIQGDDDYTHINDLLKKTQESSIKLKLRIYHEIIGSYLKLYRILNYADEYTLFPIREFVNKERSNKGAGKNIYLDKTDGKLTCTYRAPDKSLVFKKPLSINIYGDVTPQALAESRLDIVQSVCMIGGAYEASSIEELDLTDLKIGLRIINPFAHAIYSGYLGNLKSLNLTGNDIDDQITTALAQWLKSGYLKNLETLELGYNNITWMGFGSFTHIEPAHVPHLTKIGLSFNPLGDQLTEDGEIYEIIDSILTRIRTIKEIDLNYTKLNSVYLDRLKFVYKVRVRSKPEESNPGECTIS